MHPTSNSKPLKEVVMSTDPDSIVVDTFRLSTAQDCFDFLKIRLGKSTVLYEIAHATREVVGFARRSLCFPD